MAPAGMVEVILVPVTVTPSNTWVPRSCDRSFAFELSSDLAATIAAGPIIPGDPGGNGGKGGNSCPAWTWAEGLCATIFCAVLFSTFNK